MNRTEAAEKEWIDREEADRARDAAWERQREAVRENQRQSDRAKAQLLRRCPKCSTALELRTLRGVEVSRCNGCNGTWLESGQLEVLMRPELGFWQRVRLALGSPKVKGEDGESVTRDGP